MTRAEARRLLELVRKGEQTAATREEFAEAVRFFMANHQDEAAAEIAAGVWRLWMVAGDVADGRAFLAEALDHGERKPSGARARALYGDGILAFRQGSQDESQTREHLNSPGGRGR